MTKPEHDDQEPPPDVGYSIRVVSRLTGISSDTLRMWERRYGFPIPHRAASGARSYLPADVERLTLVVRALKLGYRVGETIRLSEAQLRERLANSSASRLGGAYVQTVQDLIDCVIADRSDVLRDKFRHAAANLGTKRFVSEVAAPFLTDLGEAWFEGIIEIEQEHLASEVLLRQVHAMLDSYEHVGGPVFVMATLPREAHSLGLMLVALYLAASDANVRIIGSDTPSLQVVRAAHVLKADAVGISVSAAAPTAAVREQVDMLATNLDKSVALWLGGRGALRLDSPPARALCINHWDEIDDALSALGSRSIGK